MTGPTQDPPSCCQCDSCIQPSSAFVEDRERLQLSVHAESARAPEDDGNEEWNDEWNDLVCMDDMGAELTRNGGPLNCQEPSQTLDNPVDTDTTRNGEPLKRQEPSQTLDNPVDTHTWARYCKYKHDSLCPYRHIINSLTDSDPKDLSFNDNDLQSLNAARQNLETLEDILRPYVKGWSQAEEQNPEVLDCWYGKGVRPTQATQGDEDKVLTAGKALAEWAGTYQQAIVARLQDPQSLEESVSGK